MATGNAKNIWQLIVIAVFYLAVAIAFLSWISTGFSALPEISAVTQHTYTLGLWALAWWLTSVWVVYRNRTAYTMDVKARSALLERSLELSTVLVFQVDRKGAIVAIDGAFEEVDGLHAADFVGRHFNAFAGVNPEFYKLLLKAAQGEQFEASSRIGSRYYRHRFLPEVSIPGGQTAFACQSVDISNENELRGQLGLANRVLASLSEAVVIFDRRRVVTYVNQAYTKITLRKPEQVIGTRTGFDIIDDPTVGLYRNVLASLKDKGRWEGEMSLRRTNGELYPAAVSVVAVKDRFHEVSHYLMLFSDLSNLERTHEELKYLADHDNLTDLPNRRLFLDRLDQAVKRAQRSNAQLAVFFIDLDRFKLINDSHGHHVGDEILKAVGNRLLSAMRHSDTVARLAGDEFTVITENIADSVEITSIAEKIMGCFQAPFETAVGVLDLSASVGIGVYPEDGEDLISILNCADKAMYKAKAEGRNGYYRLAAGQIQHLPGTMFFPSELRLALKRGQMELMYQPLQDLRDGRIIGCEGLLRWNHHCRGVISPLDFMDLSEGAGITGAIGQWALDEACQQMVQWRRQGLDLDYVSINIANSQINDPGYAEMVIDTLERYQLHRSRLMLEIPEPVLLANFSRAGELMQKLGEQGVRFCIDEFGSTMADYSYIQEVSADSIKIGHRLVARVGLGSEDGTLVRALVGIGDIVGKQVIVVGVERPGQEAMLIELGCAVAQGYLYARPLSAKSFTETYSLVDRPGAQAH